MTAVNGGPGYGVRVDPDELSAKLDATRRLRLAVNVLADAWDELPPRPGDLAVNDMLQHIYDRIAAMEAEALSRLGQAEYYLIIRPVSLVSPPPPGAMERIADLVADPRRAGHARLLLPERFSRCCPQPGYRSGCYQG
jgi:hypothetical protein